MNEEPKWEPLVRATYCVGNSRMLQIQDAFNQQNMNGDTKEIYINNLYQVAVVRDHPHMIHLSIKRLDKAPVHDWRHMQRIKNEIIGPEFEAVELYPAEDRLVDTSNQYHLWVVNSATYRFPFGFGERWVSSDSEYGAVQRPFPADATPSDCLGIEEYCKRHNLPLPPKPENETKERRPL